ncbi:MAG TPA: DUF5696 domain-containing protein [Candidatus Hydrogenedentes bacterium]|nr:DUF5696 domain-containing protein [Candidatus Hydrogenedentota bacterium]
MLSLVIAAMSLLGADDALAPRLETLKFHVERLHAITVPAELNTEKEAKLKTLEEQVAKGVSDENAFNELYLAIDEVRMWLWDNAAEKPEMPQGSFEDTPDAWTVTTPSLQFAWVKQDLSMTVKTGAETWKFRPSDAKDIQAKNKTLSLKDAQSVKAEAFNTGYSVGCLAVFGGFPELPGFTLNITINLIGNEIIFELAAQEEGIVLNEINWPKAVETGNSAQDLTVIPRMQGMLIPGDWPQAIHGKDLSNSRSFYMPWWGQIRNGHGVQVILETSDDAGGEYHHVEGGPTIIMPIWYASLGKLRYLRTCRYVFDDQASYVTMAKRYRRYVQEHGAFVSLKEKLARTPALENVIGQPVVHVGALYHFVQQAQLFNKERIEVNHNLVTFDQIGDSLKQLKEKGIDRAYVHVDGWGFYGYDNGHPDVMPVGEEQGGWDGLKSLADLCASMNYFMIVHDQYRDFYLNAVSFDDRLTITRLDGGRDEASVWCGGPQTFLSPRFSPEYVRRNHDLFAAHGINVRGAYLDVFSVVPLEESAQPAHPITRSECARYRRDCWAVLRARGYVVSSEEPADYTVGSIDLVHHGPYATFPNLGGGDATGIPVPLWSLVYHDALLLPWDMGEDGGWGIPKGDAGRLHCLLNAGLPYVGPGASPEDIARVKEAAELAQRCGMLELTNHEFLDDTHRKQRSTFSDGTKVTIDLNTKEYKIEKP